MNNELEIKLRAIADGRLTVPDVCVETLRRSRARLAMLSEAHDRVCQDRKDLAALEKQAVDRLLCGYVPDDSESQGQTDTA